MKGVIFYTQSENLSIWADASAWTNTLEKLGYDYYVMVDEQNILPNWEETKNIIGYKVQNIDQALSMIDSIDPNNETIFLTMSATQTLSNFTEPANPCYVCGPDNGGEPIFTPDQTLKLDAPNLWAIQCVSAIWGKFN